MYTHMCDTYIYIYIYTPLAYSGRWYVDSLAVKSHNSNSWTFKLRVSNPRTFAYARSKMPFESSNIPGAGPIVQYCSWKLAVCAASSMSMTWDDIVAIFFSQFCEIDISLLSLQTQPKTAPNLFQTGVEYGKYGMCCVKHEHDLRWGQH